ncbi:class I SAM-dependent methyltransferase [Candidatus Pacearchaeota archaeon]|nr:class I SAM-dependent methyltransferase [Candidatus Pacearchaeota archaeon]
MNDRELQSILGKIRADVKQYRPIVTELHKNFSNGKYKLLEVGAGARLIKDLIPKNIIYHSMDIDDEQTYPFNLDEGRFPIQDEVYDIIVCTETLEHIMYPHRVLKEMLRVAKKGATFFLSQPNEYNFLQRIYYLVGKKPTLTDETYMVVEKHQHIHRPRVKDIFKLFSNYIKIDKYWFIWLSKLSGHGGRLRGVARIVDNSLAPLASLWPSFFTRLVLVKGHKI